MKESVGYTVTLNIVIVFITIIIAFLCAALIYFKSNKVSNLITSSIEKYEGFNSLSLTEINNNLRSLGYNKNSITCADNVVEKGAIDDTCSLMTEIEGSGPKITAGEEGYCVYKCIEDSEEYYYYKIRTNMMINIPIIHNVLDIPVYTSTNRLYDFVK